MSMSLMAPDKDLIDAVRSHLTDGQEHAAELLARLVWEGGASLTTLYEALRLGIYGFRGTLSDADAVNEQELDARLARLAIRLPTPTSGTETTRALVLSTTRTGVPACLCHIFSERGLPAKSINLAFLARHRRGGAGIPSQFPSVRYVLVDCARSSPFELSTQVRLLQDLNLLNNNFVVVVLADLQASIDVSGVDEIPHVDVVNSMPGMMGATGIISSNPLTPRECDVLQRVALGATNSQVATALGISIGTVKTYIERAQDKLQARDRASTVAVAVRGGWL